MAEIKTLVQTIDDVRDWFDREVCSKCTFKLPSNYYTDETYPYKMVHPQAWGMYMPPGDMLPDGVESPVPSVTIQYASTGPTTEILQDGTRLIALNALFATWNPGIHGQDIFKRNSDGTFTQLTDKTFHVSADGWRDAWNFVDTALLRLESTDYIGGLMVDRKKEIKILPTDMNSSTPEAFPFWYAQMKFFLRSPIVEKHELISDYL